MNHPVATMAEVRPGLLDRFRELCAPPLGVVKAMNIARFRNAAVYLKKIGDPARLVLFNYVEYCGSDFPADLAKLASRLVYIQWRKDCDTCLVGAGSSGSAGAGLEPLFFTPGASDVVPTPAAHARIAMIAGLKPEKEAEYRALHAMAWPAVLNSIKESNIRNFSIHLGEIRGKLYLFSYREYVGADSAADDAKAAGLAVNQRWWKLTRACLRPLPDTAGKQTWSAMDEIYHHS